MAKTVVITQSNYIPWRGYFDLLRQADEVILLDVVQYTRRDWRNRNLIMTPSGPLWLTIPVEVKGRYLQSIDETRIADPGWAQDHIRIIEGNYRQAASFDIVAPWLFECLRRAGSHEFLSESNLHLLAAICSQLGIATPLRRCTDVLDRDVLLGVAPSQRLVRLCEAVGATRYLTGPAARAYLDPAGFEQCGIAIAWMDYDGYLDYPQCWGTFEPRVSVVDLLLNCGDAAPGYLLRQP